MCPSTLPASQNPVVNSAGIVVASDSLQVSSEDVTPFLYVGASTRALTNQLLTHPTTPVCTHFRSFRALYSGNAMLILSTSRFVDMTLDQWNTVIGINLTGQFLCSREAAREFIRRGVVEGRSKAAGKIICMSSVHEVIPWGGHVNYATSKGGVMMLMKSMAQELAPHKIRVVSIGPGAIQTPINHSAWATPDALNKLLTLIPYNRIGEPEDIGKLAAWLASDEADYITGTTIFMDGGMTLYPGFADNG